MSYRDIPISTEDCPSCRQAVPSGTQICPHCRNPLDRALLAELELKVKPDLRRARVFMGVLTALSALGLVIRLGAGRSIAASVVSVIYCGVCFAFAKRMPLGASIAAMALFLFGQAEALAEGNLPFLAGGLVLKVIFVVLLVGGIRAGYRVRDLRGQWRKRDWFLGIGALVASTLAGLLVGLRVQAG